jgi:hypothetical protein
MLGLAAFAATGAITASAASAAPSVQEIDVVLGETTIFGMPAAQVPLAPGDQPGSNWQSGPIWHARGLPVTDTMFDPDGQTVVGTLERSVNFNWDLAAMADGVVKSTANCTFSLTLDDPDLGTFDGRCGGSLLTGTLVGAGPSGHISGSYALAAGGVPGVGPYELSLAVRS